MVAGLPGGLSTSVGLWIAHGLVTEVQFERVKELRSKVHSMGCFSHSVPRLAFNVACGVFDTAVGG